jgi:hypothetical protein
VDQAKVLYPEAHTPAFWEIISEISKEEIVTASMLASMVLCNLWQNTNTH